MFNTRILGTPHPTKGGRDSSVGITTRYGLDGPGSNPGGGYRVFPGDKAAGAWRWPPTPSISEVIGRVELYLYSLWAFVVCSRANFTFLPYPTKVLYFAYHFLAKPRFNAFCYRICQIAKVLNSAERPDGHFQPIMTTYVTYPQYVEDFQKALQKHNAGGGKLTFLCFGYLSRLDNANMAVVLK